MSDLTSTQKTILEATIGHLNGSIHPLPEHIKGGAAKKVIESLLKKGLIEEDGPQTWRINEAGLHAIGLNLPQEPEKETKPATDFEADVVAAEKAVAAAEEDDEIFPEDDYEGFGFSPTRDLESLMAAARAPEFGIESELFAKVFNSIIRRAYRRGYEDASAKLAKLAKNVSAKETAPRGMRPGSKQAVMIEMMKRSEGATIEQIAKETGWNHNTIRGAIAGTLKKRLGLNVTTERLRYVGPEAKGGYTTYRIEE